MRRRLVAAGLIWAGWTALAVFFAITTSLTYISQGRQGLWGRVLLLSVVEWWVWAILTPLVVRAARAWPLTGPGAWLRVPLHLAASLAAAFVKAFADNWAVQTIFHTRPYLLVSNLALQVLIYWALVAVVHAIDRHGLAQSRAARLEAELGSAQLQLLRAQLRPHFLFNALNTISELVHEDPARADRVIGRLSELLRATLQADDRPLVTLADELRLVEDYLAIQQVRFGDRLRVTWEVPADCGALTVPHLLLQPVVENAVLHGLSPRANGGALHIAAACRSGALILEVSDDGVGLAPEWREGIGLKNTRTRLQTIYGASATLTVAARKRGGTIVTLSMPARSAVAGAA